MKHWYYLHTNGDLIHKNDYDGAAADFRESDFVKAFWMIDTKDRESVWALLVEALALGAKQERINELSEKWGCDDKDAEYYAKHVGLVLQLDGNAWCATGPGFSNLQESPAGFGDSKLEAISELAKDMGLKAGKLWNAHFSDLLGVRP